MEGQKAFTMSGESPCGYSNGGLPTAITETQGDFSLEELKSVAEIRQIAPDNKIVVAF